MARKVIWADGAVADLDAAADYISKDSPAYAASFVLQSLEAARSLGDLPERGRVVPEFKREDIREIFVFSYRLIQSMRRANVVGPSPIFHTRQAGLRTALSLTFQLKGYTIS